MTGALDRIHGLLSRQDWVVERGERGGVQILMAVCEAGLTPLSLDLHALTTAGHVVVTRDGDRLRLEYRPRLAAFLATSALLTIALALITRFVIQSVPSRSAANWYNTWSRLLLDVALGFALAYPLMRLRFARMVMYAARAPDDLWTRYAARAHSWRRMVLGAGAFGWLLIISAKALSATLSVDIHQIRAADGRWSLVSPAIHDLAWPAIGIVLAVAGMLVDWSALALDGPEWVAAIWRRHRLTASVAALASITLTLAFRRELVDTALTIELEASHAIATDESTVRIVALPGRSRVELGPSSMLTVSGIGENALNVFVVGTATFEVSDVSDPIEVRSSFVSAQLTRGRYHVIRPLGSDVLHVRVEAGRAWVRSLMGHDAGVWLHDGEEATVRRKNF